MSDHPMTLVLAIRMALWTIMILCVMTGIACLVGAWIRSRSDDYPPLDEALSGYSESDAAQDYEEGTEPPRAA